MFRSRILQDLPHVLTPRSLQSIRTSSFHTSQTGNRKFWNLFEFRKDNRKDVKKVSKKDDSLKKSKNNQLNDSSKSMLAITGSDKVYAAEQTSNNEYTFRYITRIKPRSKASRININKQDDLTALLDGNYVPTNMKLKLKGYKTLRNEQAKDFAFVPGGKCFELDILPRRNEDGTMGVSYILSQPLPSKTDEKVNELSSKDTNYNELESHYVPFPMPTSDYSAESKNSISKASTNDPTKMTEKGTQQLQSNPAINTKKQNETGAIIEDDTSIEQKGLTQSHNPDQFLVQLGSQQKDSQILQESRIDFKEAEKTIRSSSAEAISLMSQSQEPSLNSSNQNKVEPSPFTSLNQSSVRDKVSESHDTGKMNKDNLGLEATESQIKSSSQLPKYGIYESRIEQQRRASSPCSTSFVKARQNSTKQRWSGFDRPATGCCPGSSGSHGTGSQGSTRPYPPTVPTREASFKCYARERDPIVRSDITRSRKMVKTRNSVTAASIATVNFAEATTRVKGERVLLRSKSATGLGKTSQMVAYGSRNKSNSSCNEKNSCSKKRRGDCEDNEMIPGKVICTKPRRRNDCSKPKACRTEKRSCERKFTCTEKPPPPRPSCKPKKKKKICKRYCCPALKTEDCLSVRHTCPPKRKKCDNNNNMKEEDDDCDHFDKEENGQRAAVEKDPTCLPIMDCKNNSDNCGPIREICTNPRRCNKNRNCNKDDRDDDCLETDTEHREICTKPKKKECCNSRRNSRRSKSCGNRRFHSESRSLRNTKSFVTIPMFDVSIVSLRPYQNDAILRFYSCESGWKPPSSCKKDEDPCKKTCQKPEPKCLNKPKSASPCGPVKEDKCSKIMQQSVYGKKQDDPCAKPKSDPCGSSKKDTKEADQARVQRELQEMKKCKGIEAKSKTEKKKKTGLERVISPCKKNQTKNKCKFESIDNMKIPNAILGASSTKLDDLSNNFWVRRGYESSLLKFGMKPDNIIVNRSFYTTRRIKSSYEKGFQNRDSEDLPIFVEAEPTETELDEESFSSEWTNK